MCLCLTLSSCGLQLRGTNNNFKLPFASIYLECNSVIICQNIKQIIQTDHLTQIVQNPQDSNITIKIFNEQTSRDAQSFNNAGRITGYVLTYTVDSQVLQNNVPISDTFNISAHLIMQYNDATILSSNQEEANVWNNLHINASNQLIKRLVYFKYGNPDATEYQ